MASACTCICWQKLFFLKTPLPASFSWSVNNMKQVILNDAQKRYLHATFVSFELSLRNARSLLEQGDETGIFYSRKLNLSPEKSKQLLDKINQILEELSVFAGKIGLKKEEIVSTQIIAADFSNCWADLIDARSNRLNGYGEVNPQTAAFLDPFADHFSKIALEICNFVRPKQ
jgi:hypothetical protein